MPLICVDINIPPSTPQTSPTRVSVKVPAGVIRKVWVLIPYGHKALAHLIIRHGETQIIPYYGDIHGDGEQLVFDEVYELPTEDNLVLEGWNEDSKYEHRFIVRLLVLPKLYAYPEIASLSIMKKLIEGLGIE
ncbi:MAG: hypothetical protein LM558_00240 [Thermosphaera sp.]|nr:hypothetical protein [Thermosphaera sp.]